MHASAAATNAVTIAATRYATNTAGNVLIPDLRVQPPGKQPIIARLMSSQEGRVKYVVYPSFLKVRRQLNFERTVPVVL